MLPLFPIGRFTVVMQRPNFKDLRVADIDLHSGDVRTLNEQLQIGSVSETVTVEADRSGAQLNKSDATFGGTIEAVQVRELPLNGRNIATLETLAPGAIDSGSGQQATIRFAGQGIDDNNNRFDGVDASGVLRQALKSGLRLQFSAEAISEFKVDAGAYTADTGGSAGGQINLTSKSGTNQLHGSVFEFLRNSFFDARSPIPATSYPTFHLNQFGGSVGGPIVHDRAFFFADYEGFRQQLAGVPQQALSLALLSEPRSLRRTRSSPHLLMPTRWVRRRLPINRTPTPTQAWCRALTPRTLA